MTDYLTDRPDHLWSKPPKTEEPFSTPRSWHMLSDALHSFGPTLDEETLQGARHGTLTPAHATAFCGYVKIVRSALRDRRRSSRARPAGRTALEDRDLLYYLAESFRGRLVKELPVGKEHISATARQTAYRAKSLLVQLAEISVEVAQTVIADRRRRQPGAAGLVPGRGGPRHAPAGGGAPVSRADARRPKNAGAEEAGPRAARRSTRAARWCGPTRRWPPLDFHVCRREDCELCAPRRAGARGHSDGRSCTSTRTGMADPEEWAWALAHCLLHLGFGHVPAREGPREQPDRCDLAARCVVVNRFLLGFPVGGRPTLLPAAYPDGDEEQLADALARGTASRPRTSAAARRPASRDQFLVPWDGWYGRPAGLAGWRSPTP